MSGCLIHTLPSPFLLAGRRYIVTGASSGIGAAVALTVASLGGLVACVGRNAERLERVKSQLPGDGHVAESLDLQRVDDIPDWVAGLSARWGRINGVVHAAGLQATSPVSMTEWADLEQLQRVNLGAAVMLTKGLRQKRVIAESGRSVVIISSVVSLVGVAGRTAYAASKGAVNAAMRSMAVELAPERIRVYCIAPGFVRTPMFDEMSALWTVEQRAIVEAEHPLGLGEPSDVGNAAAFLLSDAARWITGAVLVADGGFACR